VPSPKAASVDLAGQRWQVFIGQIQKDSRFWLFAFLILAAHRVIMLIAFSKGFSQAADAWEIVKCLYAGARFDAKVTTYWVIPCILASIVAALARRPVLAEIWRHWWAVLYILASTFIGIVAIGYFAEFKDHFNNAVFGVIFDDMRAVLRTVWKDYPVIPAIVGAAVISAVLVVTWRRVFDGIWMQPDKVAGAVKTHLGRALVSFCILVVLIIGARGSAGRRPVQLKDAAITKDRILNKLVLNPYAALHYAIHQQLAVMRGSDLRVLWPGGDIRQAAAVAFPVTACTNDIDSMTERSAKGPPVSVARHLFLVVMESYDAWPLLARYRSLHLADGVLALAGDGILIPAFVPAGNSTMRSMNTLISGLPDCGLVINYMPVARRPFPTSIAAIFKRLGYRTRAFYAGYLSWQRIGDFCLEQGFDEVHGGGDIDQGGLLKREWGVEDDKLFDYILRHVQDDQPSFNLILTAGYHPPFTADMFKRGYPVRQVPADLKDQCSHELDLNVLGHLWFTDQCLHRFVVQAEKGLPSSVFAITGDHWSRRFINDHPNTYERSAVLMLWHGPGVLPAGLRGDRLAGSHLDILPTLVELAAPAGFRYHAFGSNLFDQDRGQIGFGGLAIVTLDWILDPFEPTELLLIDDGAGREVTASERQCIRHWQALRALSWWRVRKGREIPVAGGR